MKRLVVLVTRQHGAVVFEDEIVHAARQAVFVRQRHAVGDVADDGDRGLFGFDILVRVHLSGRLVFDEEGCVFGFANVVEQRADAGQQLVRADGFGGLLGQVGDLQTVLVGAGRISQEILQERKFGAGDFQQVQGGGESQRLRQEILSQQGKGRG